MPKKVSLFAQREQPIRWGRAVLVGSMSTVFMMSFIDVFYLMGVTPFSFEYYVGSLFNGIAYGPYSWIEGFLANLAVGGFLGIFYAYCFEYVFKRANSRLGIWVGVWHTVLAAVAVFPFFNAIHEQINSQAYPHFGLLGAGLGAPTPLLIFVGHLLFGASMGLFYGAVRADRVRNRFFEPGELGAVGDESVITSEEDHPERWAI